MSTSKPIAAEETTEAKALHSAFLAGDTVPTRILLTPWGAVESVNGSFIVDEAAAESATEAFEQHGTDLPIDFEHQTLGGRYASPNGQAPAADGSSASSASPAWAWSRRLSGRSRRGRCCGRSSTVSLAGGHHPQG